MKETNQHENLRGNQMSDSAKTRHRQLIGVYGKGPKVSPLEQWAGNQPEPQPRDKLLLTDTPKGYPNGLKFYRDESNRRRFAMPEMERAPLIQLGHITFLHVEHSRALHILMLRYWSPDMNAHDSSVAKT